MANPNVVRMRNRRAGQFFPIAKNALHPKLRPQSPDILYSKGFAGNDTGWEAHLRKAPGLRGDVQYDMYSTAVTVGTEPMTLLGPGPGRKYLLIQTIGANDVYIAFNNIANVSGAGSVLLGQNDVLSFADGICPTGTVTAVANGSNSLVTIVQGVML